MMMMAEQRAKRILDFSAKRERERERERELDLCHEKIDSLANCFLLRLKLWLSSSRRF